MNRNTLLIVLAFLSAALAFAGGPVIPPSATAVTGLGTMATEAKTDYVATSTFTSHTGNVSNPHSVTYTQVGSAASSSTVLTSGANAMTGTLKFSGNYGILQNTSDEADSGEVNIGGGGSFSVSRGAYLHLFGNEGASPGQARYYAGNASSGYHIFYTGAGIERFRIDYDGTSTFGGNIWLNSQYIKIGAYGYHGIPPAALGGVRYSIYGPAIWSNAIYDTEDARWEGQSSGRQTAITMAEGEFGVNQSATSGTAGSPITWNTPLLIKDNGNVLINTTTDDGVNKLQVNGSVAISSFLQLASPTAIPTGAPGRIYFNGTESKFKKCLTGTTWVDM